MGSCNHSEIKTAMSGADLSTKRLKMCKNTSVKSRCGTSRSDYQATRVIKASTSCCNMSRRGLLTTSGALGTS